MVVGGGGWWWVVVVVVVVVVAVSPPRVRGPPIGCLLSPLLPGSAVRLLAVCCLHSPGVCGPPALRAGCLLSLPLPPPFWVHGPPLLSVVPPVGGAGWRVWLGVRRSVAGGSVPPLWVLVPAFLCPCEVLDPYVLLVLIQASISWSVRWNWFNGLYVSVARCIREGEHATRC